MFHYENNAWVNITTPDGPDPGGLPDGIHADTQTICGDTTTLSRFIVLVSDVVRRGFYTPVNPTAGFLDTVKGGATVPLKFEVFVDGVEQTATGYLATPTLRAISCDTSAPRLRETHRRTKGQLDRERNGRRLQQCVACAA